MQLVTSPSVRRSLTNVLVAISSLALVPAAPAVGAGGPLADAKGDPIDVTDQGASLTDLASIDVRYDADTLYFELSFFTEISAPSAGQPNGLAGLLEFDIDQDGDTGLLPAQNNWAPPFEYIPARVEFALFLASEWMHPGSVELRGLDGSINQVPVTYTSHGVSGQFPLTHFWDGNGVLDFMVTVGDPIGPTDATDAIGTSYRVCDADVDRNGVVDFGDLLAVLAAWGTDAGDVTGDGMTDFADLLAVLAGWGACG